MKINGHACWTSYGADLGVFAAAPTGLERADLRLGGTSVGEPTSVVGHNPTPSTRKRFAMKRNRSTAVTV